MTRSMVADGRDTFRVVVRRKKKITNPEYAQGNGESLYVLTDEEYDSSYGPYPKIGTARGVESHEAYKLSYRAESGEPRSERQWDVVDSWIEKIVKIEWERIQ